MNLESENMKRQWLEAAEESRNARLNCKRLLDRCTELEYELSQQKKLNEVSARSTLGTLPEENKFLKTAHERLIREMNAQREITAKMTDQCNASTAKLKMREEQLTLFQELENSLRNQNGLIIEEIEFSRKQVSETDQRIANLEKENEDLKQALQDEQENYRTQLLAVDKKLKSLDEDTQFAKWIPTSVEKIKRQEKRIKKQMEILGQGQAGLRQFIDELISDLSLAIKLSPLSDLLKLTEHELKKLEIEVKKTPISDPTRKSMEIALGQLIEQRDFLKETTDASSQIWVEKIQKMRKFSEDFRLEELPPLPSILEIETVPK